MGGRGRASGINIRQMTIEQYNEILEIQKIKERSTQIRERGEVISKGSAPPIIYKRCYCCRNFTLPINSTYDTCPICGWIDDEYQNLHPDCLDGMNELSLNMAREKYKRENK